MQKTSKVFLLALLLGSVAFFAHKDVRAQDVSGGAIGEVTKDNWRQHPKIKEVRSIYESVNAGRKRLRMKKRSFEYCEPHEDSVRILGTDAGGRVRLYQKEGGSEDSALKFEHYYDEAGRLRFVLITGGAVNGSKVEHRIYFDADGKRIWEIRSFTDPGYTWPEVWPDEELQISDPAAKFSSDSPCPEIKARAGGRRRARG